MQSNLNKSVLALGIAMAFIAQTSPAAIKTVTITPDFQFVPEKIQVEVGDTVEFTNESAIGHTVTADPSLARIPSNVILPAGAEPFNSGIVPSGQTFDHTFTVPGLYQYICLPHELHGMKGQVEVVSHSDTSSEGQD